MAAAIIPKMADRHNRRHPLGKTASALHSVGTNEIDSLHLVLARRSECLLDHDPRRRDRKGRCLFFIIDGY